MCCVVFIQVALHRRLVVIALWRLSRRAASFHAQAQRLTRFTGPVSDRRALRCPRSVYLLSLVGMPQTNKSRNAPAHGKSAAESHGAREESHGGAAAGGGAGGGETGDRDIIKSPSDPKQYR